MQQLEQVAKLLKVILYKACKLLIDLLPHAHVRVAVPLERGLQLLQLLACEVRALPPLLLLLGGVLHTAAACAACTAVLGPLGFPAALLL